MFGLSSRRPTTTASCAIFPLTRDELAQALIGYYESAGYGTASVDEVDDEVHDLIVLGSRYTVGTVVERRLNILRSRHAFT